MKIALTAPFEEPVPPEKYGGTELVVSNLAECLVALGHEVHLFASGDSKTSATLHPIFAQALRKEPFASDRKVLDAMKFVAVFEVIKKIKEIRAEIVHN